MQTWAKEHMEIVNNTIQKFLKITGSSEPSTVVITFPQHHANTTQKWFFHRNSGAWIRPLWPGSRYQPYSVTAGGGGGSSPASHRGACLVSGRKGSE